ncbi:MAG: hypothetical protein R2852_04480 [Bacteroidia bacterium]
MLPVYKLNQNILFQTFILSVLLLTNKLNGQVLDISQKRHRIKASLVELSHLYLYTVKCGYEYKILNSRRALETELGYTFYSREDSTKARGYYIGLSYNQYSSKYGRSYFVFKTNPYYHRINMNHYLRYDNDLPDFGKYYDYSKTKYHKERIGVNMLFCWQHAFSRRIFTELNSGLGLVFFRTVVPNGVTQESFRNGSYRKKETVAPTFILALKIGYAF